MLDSNSPSKTFLGVRFVLFGFDSIHERQVRAKLLNGGGVDADQYSQNCSHVIVDKIVYDDPLCVAARNDGKTLVTALWVDHSCDIGMAVDATSIMYRPPRDLNGIPGAKHLIVCLTGYQRQDRDDIMTMVSLMGAQFSKPLVANRVTHLICYKFEGEKYELASKLKKIKLVNHRWLEDCLRDWELLPEDNYNKSGYEMEMMEAEAKDSEEDTEDITVKQSSHQITCKSPQLKIGTPKPCRLPKSTWELPKMPQILSEPEGLPSVVNKDMLLTPGRKNRIDSASGIDSTCVSEVLACQVACASDDAISVGLPDPQERTPKSTNGCSNLESIPRSTDMPNSDAKFSVVSYVRRTPRKSPQKSSSPILSGELDTKGSPKLQFSESILSGELGNIKGSPKLQFGESVNMPSGKFEFAEDLAGYAHAEHLQKGNELLYKEASSSKKQKIDVLCLSPKHQNMSHNAQASVAGSPLTSCNQGLELVSLVDGLSKFSNHSPLGNGKHDNSADNIVTVDPAQKLQVDASTGKSSKFKKKPFTQGLLIPESTAPEPEKNEGVNEETPRTSFIGLRKSSLVDKPEDRDFGSTALEPEQNEDVNGKTPQTSFIGLRKSSLVDKPEDRDFRVEKSDFVVADAVLPQHQQQDERVPSSCEEKSETEKCQTSVNLEELHEGNRNLVTKPGRKKTIARKTLGSRPKLNSTANQKGSIYSNKVSLRNDLAIGLSGERTDHEKLNSANEPGTSLDTFNASAVNEVDKKNRTRTGDSFEIETNFMDDETEASEDKAVDLSHKAENEMELKQKGALHTTNNAAFGMEDSGKEDKNAADQLQQKDEPTCKVNGLKGKVSKGKRQPSGKARTKTETVPPVLKQAKAKEDLHGKEFFKGSVEEKAIEQKKTKPCTTSKTKSINVAGKESGSCMEAEKENKPIEVGGQDINRAKEPLGKTVVKSDKVSMKDKQKSWKNNPNRTPAREVSKQVKTEPVWFILSGHKLQRKEFQQVIRRLKGKACRDSHQWSYQATHFIAPDPIRRTEKFFAAAASGRWILKTDYLTACSQSGKFLDEEPYEWHKNGLSEDGAINLEAPRKWRLLREKTGHGAFYGMRIIIYGECISPPLDTLKRVVKAGDGTIIATSPPYTRFLESGFDYAIVSPGMPRVDLWVQEFLQHEIPCIVADYLVEYVCKPGYSLERHVLYNTHAWAEKSFENLMSRAEEIVEDFTPPSDTCNSDDTACRVCGSRDRGDVMLLCGDESGSIGCGIGMHMDCFDPPLENIPEEDWFCPNCNGGSNSNISAKRRRKGNSSLKTK